SIQETLVPYLLQKEFGKEIIQQSQIHPCLSVSRYAGSSPSVLAAEIFLTTRKNILFLADDKEEALYMTAELEDMAGEENVLYFPPSHLEPYQIEKVQNANLVLRTEVLNRLNSENKPKVIVAPFAALNEKVLKKEDFKAISHTIKVGDSLDFDFVDELLMHYNFTQ